VFLLSRKPDLQFADILPLLVIEHVTDLTLCADYHAGAGPLQDFISSC
jgi:hypothetical protein